MRAPLTYSCLLAVGCFAAGARAQEDPSEVLYRPPPIERRGDFAMGASFGAGLALAHGYPNEAAKIGDPDFDQRGGAQVGTGSALWLGGALRDWFVLGFGFAHDAAQSGSVRVSSTAFITHVEVYPLYSLGGAWRDLSSFADLGAGGGKLSRGNVEVANGGIVSTLGFGVGFEALRWGGFAFGPTAQYLNQWSTSMHAHFVNLGLRLAFYASGS